MGRKEKKKQETSRTYLKVQAEFRCSNLSCKKNKTGWRSVHAWEQDEDVKCVSCFQKADIVNVADEMLILDNYVCVNPKCYFNPDKMWQSIHDGKNTPQECWVCNSMVTPTPSGSQTRFGRHFWLKCLNKECSKEWEDFSTNRQRTQYCSECHYEGYIIRLRRRPWRPFFKKGKGGPSEGEAGSHDAAHCDMCRDLFYQGMAMTCLRFRMVQCLLTENPLDGSTVEIINNVE